MHQRDGRGREGVWERSACRDSLDAAAKKLPGAQPCPQLHPRHLPACEFARSRCMEGAGSCAGCVACLCAVAEAVASANHCNEDGVEDWRWPVCAVEQCPRQHGTRSNFASPIATPRATHVASRARWEAVGLKRHRAEKTAGVPKLPLPAAHVHAAAAATACLLRNVKLNNCMIIIVTIKIDNMAVTVQRMAKRESNDGGVPLCSDGAASPGYRCNTRDTCRKPFCTKSATCAAAGGRRQSSGRPGVSHHCAGMAVQTAWRMVCMHPPVY